VTNDFEYKSYNDDDHIATLEHKAAELDRLMASIPRGREPRWANVATPDLGYADSDYAELPYPDEADFPGDDYPEEVPADFAEPTPVPAVPVPLRRPRAAGGRRPAATGPQRGAAGRQGGTRPAATGAGGGRTEALINHGRQRARRSRLRWMLPHWKVLAVAGVALTAGMIASLVAMGGSGPSWPASVVTVQAEIRQACQNPDTAAEPSGLNFACDKDTQSVLWVYSLLTSGNNGNYVDQATGRTGLEPITPAQGGNIAWSLNLHHPYNAADPEDSLQVAARAINNIISGATLTSAAGKAQIEPGLESKAANCERYTGSAALVTRAGYPAHCASAASGSGQAALVTDVFKQWMGSTPAALADEAGVLFENSGNPGNAQVQQILKSLPASGG
jgi:hypothetical protein